MSVPQASLSSNLSAERDSSLASPVCRNEAGRLLAPIALFVYNRAEHARQTLESLRANQLAQQSDLFVFSDGAKNESGVAAVGAVRKLIRAIEGFKSLTIIERKHNLGLSNSIITGVTQLCRQHGRAIVLEDDLLTTSDFLTFVNQALDRYENAPQVFSVTGFNFPIPPPPDYPYDAYASARSCSWGWGTWRDRWEKTEWCASAFDDFISSPEGRRRISEAGSDLAQLLAMQTAGKIQGWDVIWGYEHLRHSAVAIRPSISRVYNIGFDGSGIHCRRAPFQQRALDRECSSRYRFPEVVSPDPYFGAETQRLHRLSYVRRVGRRVLSILAPRSSR